MLESEDKAQDVRTLLRQHGIEIAQEFPEKKINLAYPIKKATQALFVALRVSAEPDKIKLFEKDSKSSKNILRSLIITIPKEKQGKNVRGEETRRPSVFARRKSVAPREQRESKPKPLSNEAIEKKIEEILQ